MMYKTESHRLARFDRMKNVCLVVLFSLSLGTVAAFLAYERDFGDSLPEDKSLAIWASLCIATVLVASLTRMLYLLRPRYIRRLYQDQEAATAVIHNWCPYCLGIDSIICPYAPLTKRASKKSWLHHGIRLGRVTRSRLYEAALPLENPKLKRSLDQTKKSLAMFYCRKAGLEG